MKKIKVLFMGSGLFALEVFKVLENDENIEVQAVFTQPDKPVGRKKLFCATIVGKYAEDANFPLYKAEKSVEILKVFDTNFDETDKPDYIVVADYGVILSEKVLNLPKKLCLNVHGSLLPKYRGASPVHAGILANDLETGVCIITMEKGLDTGPVWGEKRIKLDVNETYESLLMQLGSLGGELVASLLPKIDLNKEFKPQVQNESKASFAPKIKKEDGFVDLSSVTATEFWSKYRAYSTWPKIYIEIQNLKFVLTKVEIFNEVIESPVAMDILNKTKLFFYKKKLILKIADKFFLIDKFKPESKSEMDPYSFSLGHPEFFQTID